MAMSLFQFPINKAIRLEEFENLHSQATLQVSFIIYLSCNIDLEKRDLDFICFFRFVYFLKIVGYLLFEECYVQVSIMLEKVGLTWRRQIGKFTKFQSYRN